MREILQLRYSRHLCGRMIIVTICYIRRQCIGNTVNHHIFVSDYFRNVRVSRLQRSFIYLNILLFPRYTQMFAKNKIFREIAYGGNITKINRRENKLVCSNWVGLSNMVVPFKLLASSVNKSYPGSGTWDCTNPRLWRSRGLCTLHRAVKLGT